MVKRYTDQELITQWKSVFVRLKGQAPSVSRFTEYGLPDIGFYNRIWGNYSNFKAAMGLKNIPAVIYKKKINPKRFFTPQEWTQFLNVINNLKHKFWVELLLHTGARYEEALNIKLQDVDFTRRTITILKPKGGRGKIRTISISTYLTNRINNYAQKNKMTANSYLMENPSRKLKVPTNMFMNKAVKVYCKKIGIKDYYDFSCHTFRKTLEMWGCAQNVSPMVLTSHLGHTIDVAQAHYVSTVLSSPNEKVLIRSILDDLWI